MLACDLAHDRPQPDVAEGPFSRLAALCLLVGHSPAHEARCPALGNPLMSGPTSAGMAAATALTPGIVWTCANASRTPVGTARSQPAPVQWLLQEVPVGRDLADQHDMLGLDPFCGTRLR
jgi:hypothetical protein